MKKRTADTLVEVIIAMAAFGIIMQGTFDFMANQTLAMVKMRERDDIDFWAQKWINTSFDLEKDDWGDDKKQKTYNSITITKEQVTISADDGNSLATKPSKVTKLVINKGSTTITYSLQ